MNPIPINSWVESIPCQAPAARLHALHHPLRWGDAPFARDPRRPMMSRWFRAALPALLLAALLPPAAFAVIKNIIPLRTVVNGEQMIFEATVEKIDAEKPAVWF